MAPGRESSRIEAHSRIKVHRLAGLQGWKLSRAKGVGVCVREAYRGSGVAQLSFSVTVATVSRRLPHIHTHALRHKHMTSCPSCQCISSLGWWSQQDQGHPHLTVHANLQLWWCTVRRMTQPCVFGHCHVRNRLKLTGDTGAERKHNFSSVTGVRCNYCCYLHIL